MTVRHKTNLVIFVTSILLPYVLTILFARTTSLLILLPIFVISLIVLIGATIILRNEEPVKTKRKYYSILAICAFVFYFPSYSLQLHLADRMHLKIHEDRLNRFVTEIKQYQRITEMSDGERFWKTINNTSIEPKIENIDTTDNGSGKKFFLDDVLAKDGVDKQNYELFRQKLVATGFISFETLDDGTISFTMDGFLDNCYGIAYSETGIRPEQNGCGDIIRWTKIGDNWYAWGTT
jgi:hypothetical protein